MAVTGKGFSNSCFFDRGLRRIFVSIVIRYRVESSSQVWEGDLTFFNRLAFATRRNARQGEGNIANVVVVVCLLLLLLERSFFVINVP